MFGIRLSLPLVDFLGNLQSSPCQDLVQNLQETYNETHLQAKESQVDTNTANIYTNDDCYSGDNFAALLAKYGE